MHLYSKFLFIIGVVTVKLITTPRLFLFTELSFSGGVFFRLGFLPGSGDDHGLQNRWISGQGAKRVTGARTANLSAKLESKTLLMLFQPFSC